MSREPAGVVSWVTPWNYPLHQAALKTAYAMAAGCTVVLKPSEVASLSAFTLAEAAGPPAGEAPVTHTGAAMASFTRSTRAGSRVATLAAGSL